MKNNKFEQIADKILEVSMIIETVRDACIASYNLSHVEVLDIALDKQYDIFEEIEQMF